MKRSTKLALSLALSAALVVPALAQDNFPDVPANHWAYEALAKLKKDGLLVGYPDGLFRGGRPASRYELAVAIHAAYTNLHGLLDGIDGQVKALSATNPASADDVKALKEAVSTLQNEVTALKGYGDDIAALKKAADAFDKELKSLGVDVEALKKDLGDLQDRVKKLENKKPPVSITGDASFFVVAGNSRDDRRGLTVDGAPTGYLGSQVAGLTKDLSVLHEAAFTFAGTNEVGPTWKGTIVAGNLLGAQGSLSGLANGRLDDTKNTDWYLSNLEVDFTTSVAGLGFDAKVGRLGVKTTPYQFQRIDTNSYYSSERWDNGTYTLDGTVLGFNVGKAKLDVFGGRTSGRKTAEGTDVSAIVIGNNRVAGFDGTTTLSGGTSTLDRSLGFNLSVPFTKAGNLQLGYIFLDTNADTVLAANRLSVYGANADFTFGKFKVEGGVNGNKLTYNTSSATNSIDDHNTAWNSKISYVGSKYAVSGGYREVGANYIAPGDWGRIGIIRNPGNIKGWNADASVEVSSALKLSASGEFDKGLQDVSGSTFNKDTDITSYTVRLDYRVNPNLGAYLSYEDAKFGLTGVADARYKWTTIGFGYGLSTAAKLNIQYQISDVDNEIFLDSASRYTGGYLTTQLSVKF